MENMTVDGKIWRTTAPEETMKAFLYRFYKTCIHTFVCTSESMHELQTHT